MLREAEGARQTWWGAVGEGQRVRVRYMTGEMLSEADSKPWGNESGRARESGMERDKQRESDIPRVRY